MKLRCWLVVGIVVASATLAVAFWPRGPQPCLETIEQVQNGMTREEVIATLGGPPGDYSEGYSPRAAVFSFGLQCESWVANDGVLFVGFDAQNRAKFVMVSRVGPRPPSLLARLRFRLGL